MNFFDRIRGAKNAAEVTAILMGDAQAPAADAATTAANGGVVINLGGAVQPPAVAQAVTVDSDPMVKLTSDVAALTKLFGDLVTVLAKDADKDDKDEKDDKGEKKTTDALPDVISRASALVPGFTWAALTGDAAADPARTADHVCACKRKALEAALTTDKGAAFLIHFGLKPGSDVAGLSAPTVDAVFSAAAAMARAANNSETSGGARTGVTTKDFGAAPPTPEALNAQANDFWSKHSGKPAV